MWDEYIKKYVAIILCSKKATIFLGSDVVMCFWWLGIFIAN